MSQVLKLIKYVNCVKNAGNEKFGEEFAERGKTALRKSTLLKFTVISIPRKVHVTVGITKDLYKKKMH